MKKNILKATLVVAFALIAGMNVYNAQQSDVMSDLALANVEALASGESSTTNRYQTMLNPSTFYFLIRLACI